MRNETVYVRTEKNNKKYIMTQNTKVLQDLFEPTKK
jgi:hypothetical protein